MLWLLGTPTTSETLPLSAGSFFLGVYGTGLSASLASCIPGA